MPKPKNLSKALSSRERTGKGSSVKRTIAQKEKRTYDAIYNEVGQEALRFNTRIRQYEGFLTDIRLADPEDVPPTFNMEYSRRDLQRYKRGLEMRNEYLDEVQSKRQKLNKVITKQSMWTDSLLNPIPITRPETFPILERPNSPGIHSRSVFRSVPVESRAELEWLGQYGRNGFVWGDQQF